MTRCECRVFARLKLVGIRRRDKLAHGLLTLSRAGSNLMNSWLGKLVQKVLSKYYRENLKINFGDQPAMIANEIQQGDRRIILRELSGNPKWESENSTGRKK